MKASVLDNRLCKSLPNSPGWSLVAKRKPYPQRWFLADSHFGSPSHTSPLDRLRIVQEARPFHKPHDNHAVMVNTNTTHFVGDRSFEHNQSCPRPSLHEDISYLNSSIDMQMLDMDGDNSVRRYSLINFNGKGERDVSFSGTLIKGAFTPFLSNLSSDKFFSLNDSWALYNFLVHNDAQCFSPNSLRNPNKAICTIDARSTKILTANDIAASLFALTPQNLIGRRLNEFVKLKFANKLVDPCVSENHLDMKGNVQEMFGKLLECVDANGLSLPISIWIKCIENDGKKVSTSSVSNEFNDHASELKCVVVMEPVERLSIQMLLNNEGSIISCETLCANLFELSCVDEMLGRHVSNFLQGVDLNYAGIKQKQSVTGKPSPPDSSAFPCFAVLKRTHAGAYLSSAELPSVARYLPSMDKDTPLHLLTVWVFANISGQVTVRSDGRIHSCHPTLASMLFGQNAVDLVGRSITCLVPGFFHPQLESTDTIEEDVYPLISPLSEDPGLLPLTNEEDGGEKLESNVEPRLSYFQKNTVSLNGDIPSNCSFTDPVGYTSSACHLMCQSPLSTSRVNTFTHLDDSHVVQQSCSTPATIKQSETMWCLSDGCYRGCGVHRDGTHLDLVYQLRRILVETDDKMTSAGVEALWVLWISRDLESKSIATFTQSMNSMLLSNELSRYLSISDLTSDVIPELLQSSLSRMSSVTPSSDSSESTCYEDHYETVMSIGKGAYGFVKLARRRIDSKEVVVKFIRKSKLPPEALVSQPCGRKIPNEAELLMRLEHPNIVFVEAIFESDEFYQMIMPKHGVGMDLFEFIDRRPKLDELLASYMFRQLSNAVAYLHSKNIVHRDIKDENIILDDRFNIKLIDFGAAALMIEGQLFATFCGTVEYCSPEVLLGKPYRGPEADVFSMGVTLYTLLLSENPFFDLEETLAGELRPPHSLSSKAMHLIRWMLHADPIQRATLTDIENHSWTCQRVDISSYKFAEVLPNSEFAGNVASDYRTDTAFKSSEEENCNVSTMSKERDFLDEFDKISFSESR